MGELAKTTAYELTDEQIKTLAQAAVIPDNTPAAIVQVFAQTCREHGLSPFKKEIYLVQYGGKYSTIVGIDGMRAKASRSACFAGRDDAKFNVQPDGSFLTSAQLASRKEMPLTCTVTVWKVVGGMRCPFTKTVAFAEYCPPNRGGKWGAMPYNMIEKCAEAAVLRMAFADETAGLLIEEEQHAIQNATVAGQEFGATAFESAKSRLEYAIERAALSDEQLADFQLRISEADTPEELYAILKQVNEYQPIEIYSNTAIKNKVRETAGGPVSFNTVEADAKKWLAEYELETAANFTDCAKALVKASIGQQVKTKAAAMLSDKAQKSGYQWDATQKAYV